MELLIKDKLDKFFGIYKLSIYDQGRVVIHAGQEIPGVLYLEQGVVEQYDINTDGNRISINLFKPPVFFPMSVAINETASQYFYEAVTDVRLRIADTETTLQFVKANPDVLYDLLSRVYRGTDSLLRRLVIAHGGVASARLAYELLVEGYRFGSEVGDGTYEVSITQNALAARSGLARETVSRELRKLAQRGCLTLGSHKITINTKKLESELNLGRI